MLIKRLSLLLPLGLLLALASLSGTQAVADAPQPQVVGEVTAPGVTLDPTELHLVEGGEPDQYELALTARPKRPVTVTLQFGKQVELAPSMLVFTETNWAAGQVITVTAVDDVLVEGEHTATVTHHITTADPFYGDVSIPNVPVHITDNDSPGLALPASIEVAEGRGPVTYTVSLFTQPSDLVLMMLETDDQLTLSPQSLVFDGQTWHIPQTITITAVDDDELEGSHTAVIYHDVRSVDPDYNGPRTRLKVRIADNDYRVHLPIVAKPAAPPSPPPVHLLIDAPDACPGYAVVPDHLYRDDWDHQADQDWYVFNALASNVYEIETGDLADWTDTVLTLYAFDCTTVLAENDDAGPDTYASRIVWTAPADGVYRVRARAYDGQVYGQETGYTLGVSVAPAGSKPQVEPTTDKPTPPPYQD